jgi:O-antigen/teichoic acid export membrane protein
MSTETKTVVQPEVHRPALITAAKNTTANLARLTVSWIVVLVVPPLLVRVLDRPTYAVWVLILQIGAYASLFESGLQMATARFVSRAEAMGDATHKGQVLSSATFLLAGAGLLLGLITIAIGVNLGTLFHSIPGAMAGPAATALIVIGGSAAVSLSFSAVGGLYLGEQRNEVNAVAGSASKLVGAAGSAWAAFQHSGLIAMAVWIAAGNLLQPAIFVGAERWARLRSLFQIALIDSATIGSFVRFCAATMASQFSTVLITGLDMPIVVAFDFHSAAYYAVAALLSNVLILPHGAILSALMPIASGLSVHSSPQRLGNVLIRVTRYSTAILCAMGVPLLLGMGGLLRVWVGADYASHAMVMAELLVAAQFIRLTLAPYAMVGFSSGQQHKMLLSPALEAVVNLAASLWLVRVWGAIGVAAGTLLGALVGVTLHFVVSMPKTRAIGFRKRTLLRDGIVRPLACAMPAAGLFAVARIVPNVGSELALIVAAEALLLGTMWRFNFGMEERAELTATLRHFLRLRPAA